MTLQSLPFGPSVANADVTNPPLPPGGSCGLDIALVLDDSLSIGNNLSTMKIAFNGFVNVLIPATPSFFSVTYFNTQAYYTLQTLSDSASIVTGAINSVPTANNYTNWQDGLHLAAATLTDINHPRLIVFASDGQPNRYGNPANGSSSNWTQAALNAAVTEANAIKATGARIITLGLGDAVSNTTLRQNLMAISNSDAYYGVEDFSQLATTLQSLATQLCGGTITATKVLNRDDDINTTNDQTPGEGWSFDVAGSPQTTGQDGKTDAVSVTDIGPWSVIENPSQAQQDNYTFLSGGCVNTNHDNMPVGTLDVSDPSHPKVTGIQLTNQDIISCVFYNRPDSSNLYVIKQVNNSYGTGSLTPSDFYFSVSETIGTSLPFVVAGSPFPTATDPGTQVTLDGDSHFLVTETDPGAYAVGYVGCEDDIAAGDSKTCVITNTFVPPPVSLIVTISAGTGDGGGTVTSDDGNINCHVSADETCSSTYTLENPATLVTLTAAPDAGSTFIGTWSGDCSGDNPICQITMDGDKTVNAHFSLIFTPIPTPSETPTPTPTPEQTSGGGGGGGGGGGVYLNGPLASQSPTPAPQVAGAYIEATPEPIVKGAMTVLPATGVSMFDRILMSLFAAMILTGALMVLVGYEALPPRVLRKIR